MGLVDLASSLVVVGLGGGLVLLRPRSSEQVFFGVFAVAWGLITFLSNVGTWLGDPLLHADAFRASVAIVPAATLFLARFTQSVHDALWTRAVTAGAALAAVAAAVVLIAWPELAVHEPSPGTLAFGALAFPLFYGPLFASFTLACLGLYGAYRAAEVGDPRQRVRGMLAAAALFTSYQVVRNFTDAVPTTLNRPVDGLLGFQALFLASGFVLAGLVVHLATRPPPPQDVDRGLVLAFVVPGSVAVAEALVGLIAEPRFSWGLWRLAGVAFLVHAIARHRLFDLEARLRRVAGPALAAVALTAGALAALDRAVEAGGPQEGAWPLLIGLVVASTAYAGRERIGARLFPGDDDPGYADARRHQVYEAALQHLGPAAADAVDDPVLTRLRTALGLDDRDHAALAGKVARAPPAQDAAPVLRPGARVLDGYRVERLLGEGAHGRAMLAYDEAGERSVVIKAVGLAALGGRAAAALLGEAEVLAALDHPHVVRVHDVVETGREVWLVEEYVPGGSLADLLDRRVRLGARETVALLDGILAGLEAAHETGVVHRDVKPPNILLRLDGSPVLADFGVAQRTDGEATAIGAGAAGTLLYMAPEQVRGVAVDARADLYAAAVVAHRAVTGRFYLPLAGRDDYQVRRAILEDAPDLDDRRIPPFFSAVLARALAKDAASRFASAAAMRRALTADAPITALAAAPRATP